MTTSICRKKKIFLSAKLGTAEIPRRTLPVSDWNSETGCHSYILAVGAFGAIYPGSDTTAKTFPFTLNIFDHPR